MACGCFHRGSATHGPLPAVSSHGCAGGTLVTGREGGWGRAGEEVEGGGGQGRRWRAGEGRGGRRGEEREEEGGGERDE